MFVDSHCHLNYLDDPAEAIDQARALGVEKILCIGVDPAGIGAVLDLAQQYPQVFASVGEHPGNATAVPDWIDQYVTRDKVVALGEMGLDYHYESDAGQQAVQRQSFEEQMQRAADLELPVVIHTRAAEQDTIDVLRAYPQVHGVLHCFTESWTLASAGLELGYYVSISGIVTFKNADNVREVAGKVPSDRLLIETDAPWLAPVPHRGRQNQPAYVVDTAHYLAELRNEDVQELAAQTTANFYRLFNLEP